MHVTLKQYGALLATYLKPQRRKASLLAALLLGSIGLDLVNPQILRYFIDTAKSGGAMQSLTTAALLFLAVALLTQVVTVAETYVAESVGWIATNRLRADLALHCLRLDSSFHNAHTPGELIERVDGDVATLGNFFSRFVVHVLGNAVLFVGVLVLLIRIDWRVGVALALFGVVALAVVNGLRGLAVPYWASARQASADLFGFLEERLAGTEDIRSSGANAYVMRSSYRLARELLHKERKAGMMGSATGSASVVLFAVGTAISLGLGAFLYNAGQITIGTVFLIFTYTELIRRPIEQITRQMQDLQQATASIARIQAVFAIEIGIRDGTAAVPHHALSAELRNVTFGYDEDEPVLRHVSFHLQAGRTLGLLGRTGSGKTTITRLLFRLHDPSEGAVRLGGVDLRDARLADVRTRVGLVTQDIQLFHATVRDNLTLFDPGIPDQRIAEVLGELGLWEWYRTLPDGLGTKLATGGGGLSAGEAQLLAFARVFLRNPGLVILDEASSRLDPSTEHRTERAVERLLEGRTGIIIAHRLATVLHADEIMVLEDGEVREYGEREQLMSDPRSRFSGLLRAGLEEVMA